MTPEVSVLIWLIVLIVIFLILRAYGIRAWSAFVFSAAVALIILMLIYPFRIVNGFYRASGLDGLIAFIGFVTAIIVIIYLIQKVFADRETPVMKAAVVVPGCGVAEVATARVVSAPAVVATPVVMSSPKVVATCV